MIVASGEVGKEVAMCAGAGDVVLPGDKLTDLKHSESSGKAVLGPGLRRDGEAIVCCKPGIVRHREPNVYWVDSHQKRYIPARSENVLGVVAGKGGDVFKIDIGASEHASLSYMAFEGATKRNRPDVKIGDLVFSKLLVANKDMEPELVCIDSAGRSSGMGVIRDGGLVLTVTINLVRKILSPDCILLKSLGTTLPFEIAIGMNGRIWIKGRSNKETIAILNAICSAEFMDNEQIKMMVRRLLDALAGF